MTSLLPLVQSPCSPTFTGNNLLPLEVSQHSTDADNSPNRSTLLPNPEQKRLKQFCEQAILLLSSTAILAMLFQSTCTAIHDSPTMSEKLSRGLQILLQYPLCIATLQILAWRVLVEEVRLNVEGVVNVERGTGLSREEIDRLPVTKSPTEVEVCSICLEPEVPTTNHSEQASAKTPLMPPEYMILPCKHAMHKDCLMPWLSKVGSCPLCRAKV